MNAHAGEFDHKDTRRFKHTRIGIWDLYEERQTLACKRISSILQTYTPIIYSVPLLVRMLKDVLSIKRCSILLPAYFVVEVLASLIPAVSLWYSGQLLRLVEGVMEARTVDTTVLVHFAAAHVICAVAMRFLKYSRDCMMPRLSLYIKQFYNERMLLSAVRLDLPAFQTLYQLLARIAIILLRLLSCLLVLSTVMWEQQDGLLLVVLSFLQYLLPWDSTGKAVVGSLARYVVWAATTTNENFICMQGLKELITDPSHRREFVAGNFSEHISARFREASQRIGHDAVEFPELNRFRSFKDCLSITFIIREIMHVLPQIVFALRVVKNPMTTPLSLASLILIKQVFDPFSSTDFSTSSMLAGLATQLSITRKVYNMENIRNKVVDGTEPFPENQQSLANGICIEFRNVSFQYPGRDRCALRNVSFKIEAGQLCVVVGVNGSGKSTILNLISRIYDPTEGTILIDDRDIKTLKLADLRAAMSILFQDYSQFPLSMRENIGLGNPALAREDDKVHEAARLGDAEDFIDELPRGFDTYLDCLVYNYHGDLPEGTTTLFGHPVDSSPRNVVGGVHTTGAPGIQISRGQAQRLAILDMDYSNSSRTFMRSLVSETESSAGMLLFDEPSASLDPTAEHGLFERLRKLRGNKTMIFSTHRFGNLTRYANLILYIDETVQEKGTHDELMKKGGEYARIWNLQAKSFIQ
ncbi:P-loop containing nucleoside triphosphate hydrolase protein [Suillus fuscotomentosus]|uniref:P-loop containing nucleoside triphosphate hydrolase protein n=1 Tax=Suillus fuscotomentosus TaxID=1912939 RepID=A0AAD4EMS2_9AGAM|nr:P-loop containing nucleoside triphosphate hydrolase protein [Suillus fuscotomentosus]KAG1907848.1 P-loop containing nucleoside triphosphate hydrolase protein [Suillus fuscotomentosus]